MKRNIKFLLFPLFLIILFFAFSCGNSKNDRYEISKEKFRYTIDPIGFDNFQVYSYVNGKKCVYVKRYKDNLAQGGYPDDSYGEYLDVDIMRWLYCSASLYTTFRGLTIDCRDDDSDLIYDSLIYDSKTKTYSLIDYEYENYLYSYTMQFKNDKLVYIRYSGGTEAFFEYNCVKPFELVNHQVTEEEFNLAMIRPNNYRVTQITRYHYNDGSKEEDRQICEFKGQYMRFQSFGQWSDVVSIPSMGYYSSDFYFINHYNDFKFCGNYHYEADEIIINEMTLKDVSLLFENGKLFFYRLFYNTEGIKEKSGIAELNCFIEYDCVDSF